MFVRMFLVLLVVMLIALTACGPFLDAISEHREPVANALEAAKPIVQGLAGSSPIGMIIGQTLSGLITYFVVMIRRGKPTRRENNIEARRKL